MAKEKGLKRKNKGHKQESVIGLLLEEVFTILETLYFFIIFVIMPLYIKDHYYEMAFNKWKIYLFPTLALLGCVLVSVVVYGGMVVYRKHCKQKGNNTGQYMNLRRKIQDISTTDMLAVSYGVSVVITLFTCGYPRAAWLGTDSWYMGTLAQLLFVGSFLVFSWLKAPVKDVVWMNIFASGICFVIGIAQRFGWDFLHLYYGMADEVVRDYLSTIGNRTWYSGYISVMFPIGAYLFWRGENRKETILTGIYSLVAFAAIVTNNSDSIYAAVAAVLFGLFVLSVGSMNRIYRWMCVLTTWFVACSAMSVLRLFFLEQTRLLRGLSRIFMDVKCAVMGLVISGGVTFLLWYLMKKKGWNRESTPKMCRRLQLGCIAAACVAVSILVGIIVLNTTGVFEKWFGVTLDSNYLLFNDLWGDSRGYNWKVTLRMFGELPPLQKLFGVGSDCYAFYAYSNPVYVEELNSFFGQNAMVANAHNEWLNALFCQGIVGSILYIGLFLSVIVKCFKQSGSEHTHPIVPAVGLCVLGYMAHNLFCYQQVCATAPIFLLMGLANYLMKTGGRVQK